MVVPIWPRKQKFGLKVPIPSVVNVTVLIGLTLPDGARSSTVAMHEASAEVSVRPTPTGLGVHVTLTVVWFMKITWVNAAPWKLSGTVVPNALATRTQVFDGEATLLVEQPMAVG